MNTRLAAAVAALIAAAAIALAMLWHRGESERDAPPVATDGMSQAPQLGAPLPVEAPARPEVSPGDAGTNRRTLRGMVVGDEGDPVAEARVVAGKQLLSNGDRLGGDLADTLAMLVATTDIDGRFELVGVGDMDLHVAAEHEQRGRSRSVLVDGADIDPTVELRLRPFASLRGRVTAAGRPAPGAIVVAHPYDIPVASVVTAGDDGVYAIGRLAPNAYLVTARLPRDGIGGGPSTAARVELAPAAHVERDLRLELGDVTLEVPIAVDGDAMFEAAQVFLTEGAFSADDLDELRRAHTAAQTAGSVARQAFAQAGRSAVFDRLVPGRYTLCVVPVSGDMNDPQFLQRLQDAAGERPCHCESIEVTPAPARQQHYPAVFVRALRD